MSPAAQADSLRNITPQQIAAYELRAAVSDARFRHY